MVVNGQTILGRLLDQFSRSNAFAEIYVNASYQVSSIAKFVSDRPLKQRPQMIWEPSPMGTAYTVCRLLNRVGDRLVVVHGDLLLETESVLTFVKTVVTSEMSWLAVHERSQRSARSQVVISGNRVVEVMETSTNLSESDERALVNSGIYCFGANSVLLASEVFKHNPISPGLLNHVAASGGLIPYRWTGKRVSIETGRDLEVAQSVLLP
jgi:NDP-sugar pyrophosphorylase family protein